MNKSGMEPIGRKVLVLPDEVEQVSEGGVIVVTDDQKDRYNQASSTGTVVAIGPDAFTHGTESIYRLVDGDMKLVEKRVDGYGNTSVKPGDRVVFAKFAGKGIPGMDGEQYRVINDEDITAFADESLNISRAVEKRRALGKSYE